MLWAEHVCEAEEAMARLCAGHYDLVLVEPDLAGSMSGYALCAWWREYSQAAGGDAHGANERRDCLSRRLDCFR